MSSGLCSTRSLPSRNKAPKGSWFLRDLRTAFGGAKASGSRLLRCFIVGKSNTSGHSVRLAPRVLGAAEARGLGPLTGFGEKIRHELRKAGRVLDLGPVPAMPKHMQLGALDHPGQLK